MPCGRAYVYARGRRASTAPSRATLATLEACSLPGPHGCGARACKRASRTELPHHTAMRRTMQAADIAGIRAFAVHAKDEAARAFYQNIDFIPSPTDPLH